jgi:hypothetical protein
MKMNTSRSMSKDHRIRTPFQGEFLVANTQAWKPWAMVSNRFAVGQLRGGFFQSLLGHSIEQSISQQALARRPFPLD